MFNFFSALSSKENQRLFVKALSELEKKRDDGAISTFHSKALIVDKLFSSLSVVSIEELIEDFKPSGDTFNSTVLSGICERDLQNALNQAKSIEKKLKDSIWFRFSLLDGIELFVDTKYKKFWFLDKEALLKTEDVKEWKLIYFELPNVDSLRQFLKIKSNPYSTSKNHLLGENRWLTKNGGAVLEYLSPSVNLPGGFILYSDFDLENETGCDFFNLLVANALIGKIKLRDCCTEKGIELLNLDLDHEKTSNENAFAQIDSYISPLPELTETDLTDPEKGLWELWGEKEEVLKNLNIRARNPEEDIKHWPVSIDFGTSSTVVAYQEEGKKKLLRIGVKDFYQTPEAKHFENPTVLGFRDFKFLTEAWQKEAYRPSVSWADVKCSHEALANLRDNEGDTRVTASILTKIKHWALKEASSKPSKIIAQSTKEELELPNLTLRQSIKGEKLQVSENDPFDPVELYAWYLGIMINWRGRGIFLKYFMSFPVAYPQEVKDKIRSSFQRGLQRSFPDTLVDKPVFGQFEVKETASEPTALAAATLPVLGIEPSDEGETYAVFDFGGGTTDFDYGIYRYATEEEEDRDGIEEVFENFGASGDKYLGGENLLENLAYLVLKHNYDLCRKNGFVFTKPMDAEDFPGSELLLQSTLSAQTNTQMVMAKLRSYWEEDDQASSGTLSLNLLNRFGAEARTNLVIDYEELDAFLTYRITQGVKNFFIAMQKGMSEQGLSAEKVHIVLAGNASHSRYISTLFNLESEAPKLNEDLTEFTNGLFQSKPPQFVIYPPIDKDPKNHFKPNAKTAVALGLLEFRPGSPVRVINRNHQATGGEAIFNFYVGRIRRRKFTPLIKRGAIFGEWVELGIIRDRVFDLVYSHSPQSNTGEMPETHPELNYKHLNLAGRCDGQKLFAMVVGPNLINYCSSESEEAVLAGDYENFEELALK